MALADRARNEPRDLYDFWYLTTEAGIAIGSIADAIRQKLAFRDKPFEGLEKAIADKEARLKILHQLLQTLDRETTKSYCHSPSLLLESFWQATHLTQQECYTYHHHTQQEVPGLLDKLYHDGTVDIRQADGNILHLSS